MPASVDRIRDGISPVLAQAGVDLEAVQVQSAGRRDIVRVIVDRDGGVDLDLVATLSRDISAVLDAPELADALAASYVLEVSSPGVDRPLTEPRHWRRAAGRLVEAQLADGTVVAGRIERADDTSVRIDGRSIPLGEIDRGLVQVEFTRPGADEAALDAADDAVDAATDEGEG